MTNRELTAAELDAIALATPCTCLARECQHCSAAIVLWIGDAVEWHALEASAADHYVNVCGASPTRGHAPVRMHNAECAALIATERAMAAHAAEWERSHPAAFAPKVGA